MKSWNELTIIQKTLVAICITAFAFFLPEMMFLIHFGGVELAFTILLVTFKPAIDWLHLKYRQMKLAAEISVLAFRHSALNRPLVFATQASFCVVALSLTSSWFFALSFFIPGTMLNGNLV